MRVDALRGRCIREHTLRRNAGDSVSPDPDVAGVPRIAGTVHDPAAGNDHIVRCVGAGRPTSAAGTRRRND